MKVPRHILHGLVVGLFGLPFVFILPLWPSFVLFTIGLMIGVGLLWFDELYLWKWYSEPASTSQLITRSPLFLLIYIPLALFVVTSTGSRIGIGLILAMGIILTLEMWELRQNLPAFQQRFGQYLVHSFTLQQIQIIGVVSLLIVGVLTWLSLF